MMESTFYSKFDWQTHICFSESLIVENTTYAFVWYVVITWICDELFRMGGGDPPTCVTKIDVQAWMFHSNKEITAN